MAEVTDDDFPTENWVLLRIQPGDVPAAVRLRMALKRLLRDFGIRCVKVQGEVPTVERSDAADAK